ncbi:MAG: GIY-YIG nuclease family protein [Verrucomicrobia bacterium]|nr:GIY-YIG nuclease family protein [Verrucomicrobiota bacterium]
MGVAYEDTSVGATALAALRYRKEGDTCTATGCIKMQRKHPTRKAARTPGVYLLWLELPRQSRLTVGTLGTFDFPPGVYVYTGSALGGLEQRLARHRRRRKKMHWHIDYLLRHAHIVRITAQATRRRLECSWNARTMRLAGARVVAPRFGSSDCDCPTHLVYLGEKQHGYL